MSFTVCLPKNLTQQKQNTQHRHCSSRLPSSHTTLAVWGAAVKGDKGGNGGGIGTGISCPQNLVSQKIPLVEGKFMLNACQVGPVWMFSYSSSLFPGPSAAVAPGKSKEGSQDMTMGPWSVNATPKLNAFQQVYNSSRTDLVSLHDTGLILPISLRQWSKYSSNIETLLYNFPVSCKSFYTKQQPARVSWRMASMACHFRWFSSSSWGNNGIFRGCQAWKSYVWGGVKHGQPRIPQQQKCTAVGHPFQVLDSSNSLLSFFLLFSRSSSIFCKSSFSCSANRSFSSLAAFALSSSCRRCCRSCAFLSCTWLRIKCPGQLLDRIEYIPLPFAVNVLINIGATCSLCSVLTIVLCVFWLVVSILTWHGYSFVARVHGFRNATQFTCDPCHCHWWSYHVVNTFPIYRAITMMIHFLSKHCHNENISELHSTHWTCESW